MNGFQRVCKYQMNRTLKRMPFIILWIVALKFIDYRLAYLWTYFSMFGIMYLYSNFSRLIKSGISRKNILKSLHFNSLVIILVCSITYVILDMFIKIDLDRNIEFIFSINSRESMLVLFKSLLFFGNVLASTSLISYAYSRGDVADRLGPVMLGFLTMVAFVIILDEFNSGKASIPLLLALSTFGLVAYLLLRYSILEADDR